jgi:hypothetical protein
MRPSRSTLAGAIAVAAVLGALVVVGRVSGGSLRPSSPPTVTTVSPPAVPPPPSTTPSPVTALLRLGQVTAVTADGDVVWAGHGCAISRVDAHTGRVVPTVGLPPVRSGCWVAGMQAGAGALWVSLSDERLLRIDPASNRVVAALAMANLATPAVTVGGVWAVCCWRGSTTRHPAGWLVRVDPGRNRVVVRVRLPGLPTAVGAGPSGVGDRHQRADLAGRPDPWAAGDDHPGAGWAGWPAGTPRTSRRGGCDVLVGRDAVWVSNPVSAQVLRVDPADNRLVGSEPSMGRRWWWPADRCGRPTARACWRSADRLARCR